MTEPRRESVRRYLDKLEEVSSGDKIAMRRIAFARKQLETEGTLTSDPTPKPGAHRARRRRRIF